MSDHALIAVIAAVGFALQLTGLFALFLSVRNNAREARHFARALAGLIYQESEKTRAGLGRPSL